MLLGATVVVLGVLVGGRVLVGTEVAGLAGTGVEVGVGALASAVAPGGVVVSTWPYAVQPEKAKSNASAAVIPYRFLRLGNPNLEIDILPLLSSRSIERDMMRDGWIAREIYLSI